MGARVVELNVEVSPNQKQDNLSSGVKSLYENVALCDVMLVVGDESFPAHKAALATYPALRDRLHQAVTDAAAVAAVAAAKEKDAAAAVAESNATEVSASAAAKEGSTESAVADPPPADSTEGSSTAAPAPEETTAPEVVPAAAGGQVPEVAPAADAASTAPATAAAPAAAPSAAPSMLEMHFPDISQPEAIRIMLAHIYGVDGGEVSNYAPSSDEVNKDVLRLASQLQLASLKEFATHWMASGLNSSNAVPRLSTCQEFALHDLFEAAAEALASDAFALSQVTEDLDIIKHPRLLQKLLIRVAALYPKGMKRDRMENPHEDQRPSKRSRACPQEGGA